MCIRDSLRDYFHYPQFPDDIGQSWSFSAQEGEGLSNRIAGMEGMTLLNLLSLIHI